MVWSYSEDEIIWTKNEYDFGVGAISNAHRKLKFGLFSDKTKLMKELSEGIK